MKFKEIKKIRCLISYDLSSFSVGYSSSHVFLCWSSIACGNEQPTYNSIQNATYLLTTPYKKRKGKEVFLSKLLVKRSYSFHVERVVATLSATGLCLKYAG